MLLTYRHVICKENLKFIFYLPSFHVDEYVNRAAWDWSNGWIIQWIPGEEKSNWCLRSVYLKYISLCFWLLLITFQRLRSGTNELISIDETYTHRLTHAYKPAHTPAINVRQSLSNFMKKLNIHALPIWCTTTCCPNAYSLKRNNNQFLCQQKVMDFGNINLVYIRTIYH